MGKDQLSPIVWQPTKVESKYELHNIGFYGEPGCSESIVVAQMDIPALLGNVRRECRGTFVRHPAAEKGIRGDAFEWLSFEVGHAESLDAPIKEWKRVPDVEGLSYVVDFEAELDRFPIDVSRIPKTFEGWMFYCHFLDAHNEFDLLRTSRHGKAHLLQKPGDRVEKAPNEAFDLFFDLESWAPLLECEIHKFSGQASTTWIGYGDHGGERAKVLFYKRDNTRITAKMLGAEGTMEMWTHFDGHIYISDETSELLGGTLSEFIPTIMRGSREDAFQFGFTYREVALHRIG